MTILVTTPTGTVGRHVVRALVRAGVRPRVLVRDPARLPAELLPFLDVVTGDQRDVDAVVRAGAGVAALYWCAPSTGADDPVEGYAELGRVVAEAVRRNRPERVVFQSSIGAEARGGFGEIDGLGRIEDLLDEAAAGSGTAVLHLRCSYFMSNLLLSPDALREGVLTTTLPLDQAFGWVDPRDVAEVVAGRLLAGFQGRQVQAVHGPADLSFADVAAVLTEVTGRRFTASRVTDDDVRAGLRAAGMTPAQVEGLVGMSVGLREGPRPEQERSPLSTTPSTLRGWAAEHVSPLLLQNPRDATSR